MKKIVTEVQRMEKVVQYEAIDGKIFNSEESCKKWEADYMCTINKLWKDIPKSRRYMYDVFPCGSDDEILLIKVRNMDDLKVINSYLKTYCNASDDKLLGMSSVGTEQLIIITYDGEWCNILGEKHELISNIQNEIKKMEIQNLDGNILNKDS